jgi:hypothetical protein
MGMLQADGGKSLIERIPWRQFIRRQQNCITIAVAWCDPFGPTDQIDTESTKSLREVL